MGYDRSERGAEGCSHARRRTGGKQDLALAGGHANHLAEQRADRAPGHDDRALGSERAAGTNRDGG